MSDPANPAVFWILSAGLAGLALALVLPPLLRRTPPGPPAEPAPGTGPGVAPGEAGRDDGRGRGAGYLLAGLVPACALGVYLLVGSPGAVTAQPAQAPEPLEEAEAESAAALRERLPALQARVRENPQDGEAWALLARTLGSLGEFAEAVPAYAEATRLLPESAPAWSGYAEALAISRGHVLDGEPYQMALKAVELDMNDLKGLELLGIYHFQQGSYGQAAFYWRRLARLLPPDSPFGQDIAGAAAEATARARAALDASPEAAEPAGAPGAPAP